MVNLMQNLKKQFLQLLEKDKEFRYTVAGYLGISEMMKRFDATQEEIKKLREDFNTMRAEVTRIWEEMRLLREEQRRLREDFNKMLEVVKTLQEDVRVLKGDVATLKNGHKRLERELTKVWVALTRSFEIIRMFAGRAYESFVRSVMSDYLIARGIMPEGARLRRIVIDGEEINLFHEDPLIVGEVTARVEDVGELDKLMRKVEVARKKYGREPYRILVALTATKSIAKDLQRRAKELGVELIVGRYI